MSSLNEESNLELPPLYVVNKIPVHESEIITNREVSKWDHLKHLRIAEVNTAVELMLGSNVPQAMEPWEVINSKRDYEPYAIRTRLGWVICGAVGSNNSVARVNKVSISEGLKFDRMLIEAYNRDFEDLTTTSVEKSEEDKRWLEKVERGCKLVDGRYEIPLPLKISEREFPKTREVALRRLYSLKKKFRDVNYSGQYKEFMNEMLNKGYAEVVPIEERENRGWYIPHFGVTHSDKPGKVRIVFDCAAKVTGVSLNDMLMTGPDILNLLLGVLMRFRKGLYAFTADIQTMFYQVKVPAKDRDYLRFLWMKDDDWNQIEEYRMCVHLFGASSSPGIANYALQKIVEDNKDVGSEESLRVVRENFYVDDCLYSGDNKERLCKIAREVNTLCSLGGFNLTKYVSSSKSVLESIPTEHLGKNMPEYLGGQSVIVKTLGVQWNLGKDRINIDINIFYVPNTRRKLLSQIAAVYDPLGIVGPLMIEGRIIIQEMCRIKMGWDEVVSTSINDKISKWINKIQTCTHLTIQRCLRKYSGLDVVKYELHLFSDASEKAYGAVSYLKVFYENNQVSVVFLLGKTRVAPLKHVSVPRLELVAATTAVKLFLVIKRELDIAFSRVYFWTDSTIVLRYIKSETLRFQTFVANRVSTIRSGSEDAVWRHVGSESNPADDASRGRQTERWLEGPKFLFEQEERWPKDPFLNLSDETDLEIKRMVNCTKIKNICDSLISITERYSSWEKLKRAVGWLIKYKQYLQVFGKKEVKKRLSVEDLREAEMVIFKTIQRNYYFEEYTHLEKGREIRVSSSLRKLNPMLIDDVMRVKGRLEYLDLNFEEKNPIILPGKCHVSELLIRREHEISGHMGLMCILAQLRQRFWIVKGNSSVRRVLSSCVDCRRYKGKILEQQMSNLPFDRARVHEPPFTVTGCDCFGPFYVKRGRTQVKRYGVIFTCLTIRAVHLEVAADLSTDSFINCLRRFLARRGGVKKIRSDNGTNFVGARSCLKELGEVLSEEKVCNHLLNKGIEWEMNPPGASHFGGVWERQIGTVRKVLDVVMGSQLVDDDSLSTLFCEVEAVINSRPLSVVSSDSGDLIPVTPFKLLSVGSSVEGINIDGNEGYPRRRWKQVQYLADQFWKRWSSEYLLNLQKREKWQKQKSNIAVGNVVLMVDSTVARCHWLLAVVDEVKFSIDGLVRSVVVRTGSKKYVRPLSKLVLLLEE